MDIVLFRIPWFLKSIHPWERKISLLFIMADLMKQSHREFILAKKQESEKKTYIKLSFRFNNSLELLILQITDEFTPQYSAN